MKQRIFSMPLNATMNGDEINKIFVPFVKEYHDYLYDIYFSCFIPPFTNDAMSAGTIYSDEVSKDIFGFMMWCQDRFGVKASATFNNFTVLPNQENMELFIKNLKPYYDAGLRTITIPHAHWIRTGRIKEEYPELFVKNTVLRRVYNAQEYANAAEGGFDLINVDCSVIRDRDTLIELKVAYDHYQIPISLLFNEACRGKCPLRDEHYYLNCNSGHENAYFTQPISSVSCSKWRKEIPHFRLLVADLPVTRKGVDEYLEYVQVLKLHGRVTQSIFESSMDIVKRYAAGEEIVFRDKHQYLESLGLSDKGREAWEKITRNCKFSCWKCNVCETVFNSRKASGL